jgi:hypothetical protein
MKYANVIPKVTVRVRSQLKRLNVHVRNQSRRYLCHLTLVEWQNTHLIPPCQKTLVFPCRPTHKNLAHVASEDTQGSHCGHPTTKVAIKEVKTEDEAKELLSQMTKEKEVFIKLDWEGTKYKPPILEWQIAAKSFDKKGTHAITDCSDTDRQCNRKFKSGTRRIVWKQTVPKGEHSTSIL